MFAVELKQKGGLSEVYSRGMLKDLGQQFVAPDKDYEQL